MAISCGTDVLSSDQMPVKEYYMANSTSSEIRICRYLGEVRAICKLGPAEMKIVKLMEADSAKIYLNGTEVRKYYKTEMSDPSNILLLDNYKLDKKTASSLKQKYVYIIADSDLKN